MSTKAIRLASSAIAFLGIVASADASVITWSAPHAITSESDVSTLGTLVAAASIGGSFPKSPTVNGVPFTGVAFATVTSTPITSGPLTFTSQYGFGDDGVDAPAAPFDLLAFTYRTLLSNAGYTNQHEPFTLTMNALTIGATYQFEWWLSASNNPIDSFTTASAGNTVTLASDPSAIAGGVGQFALGIFTADGTSETIVFSGLQGPNIDALQLRQLTTPLAVPEPGTLALIGLGLAGLRLRRRRAEAAIADDR